MDGRRFPSRVGTDRGSSALSAAILAVVLVVLAMALVQTALYFHGRNVAASAARHGLEASRVTSGTESVGHAAANEYLDQAGSGLADPHVDVTRGDTEATVTVSGNITSVLPGTSLTVDATVHGPVERFEP